MIFMIFIDTKLLKSEERKGIAFRYINSSDTLFKIYGTCTVIIKKYMQDENRCKKI